MHPGPGSPPILCVKRRAVPNRRQTPEFLRETPNHPSEGRRIADKTGSSDTHAGHED